MAALSGSAAVNNLSGAKAQGGTQLYAAIVREYLEAAMADDEGL